MTFDEWKSDQPDPYADDPPVIAVPCRACGGKGVIWDSPTTGRLRFPTVTCHVCEGTGEALESPEREGKNGNHA